MPKPENQARIVVAGHPVLRTVAAEVPAERLGTRELADLVSTMVATMRAAPGVGLAAPQIAVPLRVFVLEDTEALMSRLDPSQRAERERAPFPLRVIVNPVVRPVGEQRRTFFEGCLSVPGYMALVERWHEVEVSGVDASGATVSWRVRGWPARIVQHELDHLDGILYVDRMTPRSLCTNAEVASRWLDKPVSEVKRALGC